MKKRSIQFILCIVYQKITLNKKEERNKLFFPWEIHINAISRYPMLVSCNLYLLFIVFTLSRYCYRVVSDINPNWHEGGHFPPPCPFLNQILSTEFISNFPNFLEVKIDINRVNLTPKLIEAYKT